MKAKFINESLENIFKPQKVGNIAKNLRRYLIIKEPYGNENCIVMDFGEWENMKKYDYEKYWENDDDDVLKLPNNNYVWVYLYIINSNIKEKDKYWLMPLCTLDADEIQKLDESYKWRPSKNQRREFAQKMQNDINFANDYNQRKINKTEKRRASSSFDYISAGGYYVPTKIQHDMAFKFLNNLNLTSHQEEACHQVIYGFTNNEKIHHDYIHIVNELIRNPHINENFTNKKFISDILKPKNSLYIKSLSQYVENVFETMLDFMFYAIGKDAGIYQRTLLIYKENLKLIGKNFDNNLSVNKSVKDLINIMINKFNLSNEQINKIKINLKNLNEGLNKNKIMNNALMNLEESFYPNLNKNNCLNEQLNIINLNKEIKRWYKDRAIISKNYNIIEISATELWSDELKRVRKNKLDYYDDFKDEEIPLITDDVYAAAYEYNLKTQKFTIIDSFMNCEDFNYVFLKNNINQNINYVIVNAYEYIIWINKI